MAVIAYDKPVRNFIAGLNATGHVTHTAHRKTSVTLHHNAGRLSLQGILDVWENRPASAHFQVDGAGNVGQYVKVNEYAWATGTTKGNQESISIEMANSTLGPDWKVSGATTFNAARLAGWLHAKVIGKRPTRQTLKVHKDWKATACAGPFIDKVYGVVLRQAQEAYDAFVKPAAPKPPKPPSKAVPAPRKNLSEIVGEVLAGKWGNGEDRKKRLRDAGYDPDQVQIQVNRRLAGGAPAAHRPSVSEVARQVIAGQWGNGPRRRANLEGAGYNYASIQAEVNRLLR